tara:strand:- start:4703 stop:4951 length:249 start_codon:yes stop_codon:yes gene_type:complete
MNSKNQKQIKEILEKKDDLLSAKVINFPNKVKKNQDDNLEIKNFNFWKINDEANSDQLRALTGICFVFGILFIMGLFSNLLL